MSQSAVRSAVGAAIALILLLQNVWSAGAANPQLDKEKKEKAVKKWKSMFGDKIEFAEKGLYGCMSYIHPQPEAVMQELDDRRVIGTSIESVLRAFFKPACRFDARKHEPDKYYLRRNGDEPGLLYYEWRTAKYTFRMYESGNGILIGIKPRGYDATKPLSGRLLASILYDVIDAKYPSADKIVEDFKLPRSMSTGMVFTNNQEIDVREVGQWKKNIIGFLSKDDICVICFFADDPPKVGFDFVPNWLDGRIFEKDGKTPVKPQKEGKE